VPDRGARPAPPDSRLAGQTLASPDSARGIHPLPIKVHERSPAAITFL